ncbi:(2Fe-2S)-binding protein [Alkalicoccobacillus gibsonii]|uniref:(2Fe-2S)-binding protein n=1 Tax=Alkalicoccobacillus gibsonii TaxID=79881 RepID=UPI003F7B5FC3
MSHSVNKQNAGEMTVHFQVNEKYIQKEIRPTKLLLDVLREDCGMTGTKRSCGIGRCGACAVHIDGKLSASCLTMAYQVEGRSVTTIENLATGEELHPVQEAMLKHGGFQCGYCTPGMVMAIDALLTTHPHPTEEQIKDALSGNLCRCTGYGGIIRSIQQLIEGSGGR